MKYIYHYYASCSSGYGKTYLIDGVLTYSGPIETMGDYTEVKKAILDTKNFSNIPVNNLTIKSLSLLQTVED